MKDYNPTTVKVVGEPDQHGNLAYSVFFEGQDKPVFMKAKNAPEVGKVEFGIITDEPKKSGEGTYRKFTRKQREEAPVANTSTDQTISFSSRDDSITRQSALKSAVATGETDTAKLLDLADDFVTWLKNEALEEVPPPKDEDKQIDDNEINIEDIPF